jgi:plastocyanin
MTVRRILAAVVAAALVPAGAVGAAGAAQGAEPAGVRAGASVAVAGMAFGPRTVTVAVGETVTWSFEDAVPHTTTSDQGFWDSGSRSSGATYARAFSSAGSFAYRCTLHPHMRGKVRVPVTATGSPRAGWKLRWATKRARGKVTFDVQTKRGSGRWSDLAVDVARAKMRFDPARSGKYKVRARTAKGAERSGWSPAVTVTIS